jgi:hypothetical protein
MPPVRAVIVTRSAPLHSEFGFSYATKLFGEEAIASLPRYQRGPHKGEIKAWLVWEKAEKGGWSQKYGVVRPGLVWARIAATAYSEMPLYGTWMGRTEALSGHRDVLTEAYRRETLRERAEAVARLNAQRGCPAARLLVPVLGMVS